MTNDVRNAVGKPDNSAFILRVLLYGFLLAVMLFSAPTIFAKIMVPMAAQGMTRAWNTVFVPLAGLMMVIGLFRSWRRRWPLAYMRRYNGQAKSDGYQYCPRCGSRLVMRKRTRFSREKVGEEVTTTTYSDGSQTTDRKDIFRSVGYTDYYHQCSNPSCALEVDQSLSQSHLPWKLKEIRCLVLNDSSLLGRKQPSARSLLLSRLLVPFLALALIVACGFTIYSYADWHDGEWNYITADAEPDRTAEEYQAHLLSMDTQKLNWHMSYEKEQSDMMYYLGDLLLGQKNATGYFMGSYTTDNGLVLYYGFEGDDAGTGVPDGRYTLMSLDGINVLIDDTNEVIYKQDTEFYNTYAPKLLTLTHDQALNPVLQLVNGGDHAIYGKSSLKAEFIRKDNTTLFSYLQSDDRSQINGEFRAVTTHLKDLVTEKWIFSYDDNQYVPDNLEGYVYSDALPQENDELGKLIKESSDGSGSYELYRGEELVTEIDIDYLANGYEFEFEKVEAGFKGFEQDATYRVNINTKTLTKITTDEQYNETETDLPLSEHQDKYDFLLSIVPDAYIRRIMDLEKAEIRTENLGLIKNYIMKDDNGNITAELKVAFGKIGEVIHHTGTNEYVKIQLGY